jgi:2,4-dienoyl-CoA reductase-like NADH-dependent reductase (Old Yellow Enzyme family)
LISDGSSTIGPRDVLIKREVGFISPSSEAPTSPLVRPLKIKWIVTMSAWLNSSSLETSFAPAASGGSTENRTRFAVEVASAVADEIGAGRTGIRISPGNPFNDIIENNIPEVYEALLRELGGLKLGYLHVAHMGDEVLLRKIRSLWSGVLILNRGRADVATRIADIEKGLADIITVGALTLANPDLVARIKLGAPLNAPDPATFYGGTAKGYTDYPTLALAPQ